jgi:DNA topoisomerase I
MSVLKSGAGLQAQKGRPCDGPSLNYAEVDDLRITRRKFGQVWAYFDSDGHRIRDQHEIIRLNAIALPPAYADARFNSDPIGHLQAIGTDARGRRQYRYHLDFRASQEAAKFGLCFEFGAALPKLRKTLNAQLSAGATRRETVIAAIVRILDTAYLRIGNEVYRQANKSFGLTTLRNRHARVHGQSLDLQYRGKGGIMRKVRVNDRSLLRIVRRCQDLPGQCLFQYESKTGDICPVTSTDVNAFLRENMGDEFTAKHFRTWHASIIAFDCLQSGLSPKLTLDRVAEALGNTPAIARKSYVHPLLLEAQPEALQAIKLPPASKYLTKAERGFLRWLETQ